MENLITDWMPYSCKDPKFEFAAWRRCGKLIEIKIGGTGHIQSIDHEKVKPFGLEKLKFVVNDPVHYQLEMLGKHYPRTLVTGYANEA